VYQTADGFIYLAVGNDRQWKAMVATEVFSSLAKPEYEKNEGRIKDVDNLNSAINAITREHSAESLIELFTSITVPVSKIKSVGEAIMDPLVQRRLLSATDPKTGKNITLAPPPNMTPFLESSDRQMTFPPRFGEHNAEYYGRLGYSEADIKELKSDGVI
jgi:formyl-CoA transferase